MESNLLFAVQTLTSHQIDGAIGYIPVFGDAEKAKEVANDNSYAIKKMEIPILKRKPEKDLQQTLNKIQNQKL